MVTQYDYDAMDQQLQAAQTEYYERREQEFAGVLKSPLPQGTPGFLKIKEGEHMLDVIPSLITTDFHPSGKPKGQFFHQYSYYMHSNLGANKFGRIMCLQDTFRLIANRLPENMRVCGVCKKRNEELGKTQPDLKFIDETKSKPRTLYIVWSHSTPQLEAEGVKILDMSAYTIEFPIQALAKKPFGGGYIVWMSPKAQGCRIYFKRVGSGVTSTKYEAHQLIQRGHDLPVEIVSTAPSLDSLVKIPTFEEGYEMVHVVSYESVAPSSVAPEQYQAPQQPTMQSQPTLQNPVPSSLQVTIDVCPSGGTLGFDFDQLAGCASCAVGLACYQKHKTLTVADDLEEIPFEKPPGEGAVQKNPEIVEPPIAAPNPTPPPPAATTKPMVGRRQPRKG